MTYWAIVPVKPLRRGKSRLASVLTEEERASLNRDLLVHTVKVLKSVSKIEHVLVVSRDQEALSVARDQGARTMLEHGAPGLNPALTRATQIIKSMKARGVLIIPADLPLITNADIYALIDVAEEPPVVVIAPDYNKRGTNALLVNPAGLLDYDFGPGSFESHCNQAIEVGANLITCSMPSLRYDVDIPEDLAFLDAEAKIWIKEQSPDGDCLEPEVIQKRGTSLQIS
jgi:2-phospho-L-lactate guanylyltransferase